MAFSSKRSSLTLNEGHYMLLKLNINIYILPSEVKGDKYLKLYWMPSGNVFNFWDISSVNPIFFQ